MIRHFLRDDDLSTLERESLLDLADKMKKDRFAFRPLAGPQSVAIIFDKPSTRTRVSFMAGVTELGGAPIVLDAATTQQSRGEPIEDMARVLDRQVKAIVWRTFAQGNLERMASVSRVPVVNALSDTWHPCQALADLQTIRERLGTLKDVTLAYFGDIACNTANSLALAGAESGMKIRLAGPEGIVPDERIASHENVEVFNDAKLAAYGADVIATDTWASMGNEPLTDEEADAYKAFTVDTALLDVANKDAFVLHCLPAYRGKEISGEVLDGPRSAAWDQAENRLHVQKALLTMLLDSSAT